MYVLYSIYEWYIDEHEHFLDGHDIATKKNQIQWQQGLLHKKSGEMNARRNFCLFNKNFISSTSYLTSVTSIHSLSFARQSHWLWILSLTIAVGWFVLSNFVILIKKFFQTGEP